MSVRIWRLALHFSFQYQYRSRGKFNDYFVRCNQQGPRRPSAVRSLADCLPRDQIGKSCEWPHQGEISQRVSAFGGKKSTSKRGSQVNSIRKQSNNEYSRSLFTNHFKPNPEKRRRRNPTSTSSGPGPASINIPYGIQRSCLVQPQAALFERGPGRSSAAFDRIE